MMPESSVLEPIGEPVSDARDPQAPPSKRPFKFDVEKKEVQSLVAEMEGVTGEWSRSKNRRTERTKEVDVNVERSAKRIGPSDTVIPIRRIHSSIMQSKPGLTRYLTSSNRILLFATGEGPSESATPLELAFSRWSRYEGWQAPWELLCDGTLLDGGGFIEVRLDDTKPLYAADEFVPRSQLAIPKNCRDIQQAERIVRVFQYLPYQLEDNIGAFGWNSAEVQRITREKETTRNEKIDIYRVWCKRGGIVYVYFVAQDGKEFLSGPTPLEIIPGQSTTQYPIFFNPLEVQSDTDLLDVRGFAFRILPSQEAETTIWTNLVNATTKASSVYSSTDDSGANASLEETRTLAPDTIVAKKLNFWAFPWPPMDGIQLVQTIPTIFTADLGQMNYAVLGRRDKTAKTAREVDASMEVASATNSIFISPLALTVLRVYALHWEIAKAVVLAEMIPDWPISPEEMTKRYFLLPAGDIDYVARNEKLQKILQAMQAAGGSAILPILLKIFIRYALPEEAPEIFKDADLVQIIQSMGLALQAMQQSIPLPPEHNAQINNIIATAQQAIGEWGAPAAAGVAGSSSDQAVPAESGTNSAPTPSEGA